MPQPKPEPVCLRDFLDQVRQLEPFALAVDAPPAAGVVFDPAQMQQVLVNLVKNAREAGSPPEEIVVAVDPLPTGGLALHVLDRGCGMDEERRTQALLPFFSSKPNGSGIGLALSREIVEAHGGSLHLAARRGGGTVVTCRLP